MIQSRSPQAWKWTAAAAFALLVLAVRHPVRAPAIPLFAHEYGVTCEKCHSVIPHLNNIRGGVPGLRLPHSRSAAGTGIPAYGVARDGVLLVGWGPTERSRLTVEDVIQHVPQTTHTMNVQFTLAY